MAKANSKASKFNSKSGSFSKPGKKSKAPKSGAYKGIQLRVDVEPAPREKAAINPADSREATAPGREFKGGSRAGANRGSERAPEGFSDRKDRKVSRNNDSWTDRKSDKKPYGKGDSQSSSKRGSLSSNWNSDRGADRGADRGVDRAADRAADRVTENRDDRSNDSESGWMTGRERSRRDREATWKESGNRDKRPGRDQNRTWHFEEKSSREERFGSAFKEFTSSSSGSRKNRYDRTPVSTETLEMSVQACDIPESNFSEMGLTAEIMRALADTSYETPTPIQAMMIPSLIKGRDAIGQAQTGTGKTAAFALPLLGKVDTLLPSPQILVLTPTRELAIQVAEAFKTYGSHMSSLVVTAIYGGSGFKEQFKDLNRGAHVVVGTPGRVMDHMRRGSLDLTDLRAMVLDEADEMLKMGFIEDVEWVLEKTPEDRQLALFSATMPQEIRDLAGRYLKNPEEILIQGKNITIDTIDQRYGIIRRGEKQEALLTLLETEETDGVIIFVRTREATNEVAEALQAAGHSATPINGDLAQRQRERAIEQLKNGKLSILVATDVAARGLDVDRISHVINYDIPFDSEAYIHRIGRTGRAGRSGSAILFVEPGERRILYSIEKATAQRIKPLEMPTPEAVRAVRVAKLRTQIKAELNAMTPDDFQFFMEVLEEISEQDDVSPAPLAAALMRMAGICEPPSADGAGYSLMKNERIAAPSRDADMQTYRIQIGYNHGVRPGNIVGAIVNETELESGHVGRIELYDEFTAIDLPAGLSREFLKVIGDIRISGRRLDISVSTEPLPPKNFGGNNRRGRDRTDRGRGRSARGTRRDRF